MLLLCIIAPITGGLDVHFYSLDMVAFIVLIFAGLILVAPAASALAKRYFPYPAPEATDEATRNTDHAAGIETAQEGKPIAKSAEAAKKQKSALQTALKFIHRVLLGGSVPICVVVGCVSLHPLLRMDSNHSHRPLCFTQTHWPSSPCIQACSTMLGASSSVSWAIPLYWRFASSG